MARSGHQKRTASENWPKRGEVHLTKLDPTIGHEIQKTRPALVIQNDTTNRYGATTTVAPITSKIRLPLSPLHVLLPAGPATGLDVPSVAVFSQIRTVDRTHLIKRLGKVDNAVLDRVAEAVRIAFGLPPAGMF